MGTSTDMVGSGYNFIGFVGVLAGELKILFTGVDGAVLKAVSVLAG